MRLSTWENGGSVLQVAAAARINRCGELHWDYLEMGPKRGTGGERGQRGTGGNEGSGEREGNKGSGEGRGTRASGKLRPAHGMCTGTEEGAELHARP